MAIHKMKSGRLRNSAEDAAVVGSDTILDGRPSAWASHHTENGKVREAPGKPGVTPHWASSAKDGVGTALGPNAHSTSLVWFTLGHGILTEIFYPRIDGACIRDLGLIVTDGQAFFSEEKVDTEHRVEYPVDGVPLYRLINTCRQGRYRIEKTIFAHPHQDAVLQITRFTALKGQIEDYHLYALLAPHLGNRGAANSAWLGDHRGLPMLFARRGGQALALASSAPWITGSAGYVGTSDGWEDLSRHKRLTCAYDRADQGNVALTGEVGIAACGGVFSLVVAFGPDDAEAGHRALASLMDDLDDLQSKYVRGWQEWQETLNVPKRTGKDGRDLFAISTAVLQTHDAQSVPGAFIASLSTPWGESRGDEARAGGTGGYHLVWPRDLVESAGGLLAAGAKPEALRVLRYLRATQMSEGHWPQNMWVSSAQFWTGIQLGETAFPILLLDLLRRHEAIPDKDVAGFWPMVKRAAGSIVRSGPSTQQDRWENEPGYTPFTLATVIAALLIAAEQADEQGEKTVGLYLRTTADAWNAAIESWLYVTETNLARRLAVEGYYARGIPPDLNQESTARFGHVRMTQTPPTKNGIAITEIVSVDALALVRFGLRAPDDPRIVNTVKVIDAVLKVETPRGPSWRRYNGDIYGEKADGSPYDGKPDGIGRAWPLLTGERAHYELEAGRKDEAIRLMHAMESLAGDGGMIPEQVWDADDIPVRGLFKGRPSGSAMPLAWAHAEYVKLRRSIQDGRTFDRPPQTVGRYLEQKAGSRLAVWRFEYPRRAMSPGEVLRVETLAAGVVHWSADAWKTSHDSPMRDTGLGIHVADLDTARLKSRDTIELTFHWSDPDRWEGKNFTVSVV